MTRQPRGRVAVDARGHRPRAPRAGRGARSTGRPVGGGARAPGRVGEDGDGARARRASAANRRRGCGRRAARRRGRRAARRRPAGSRPVTAVRGPHRTVVSAARTAPTRSAPGRTGAVVRSGAARPGRRPRANRRRSRRGVYRRPARTRTRPPAPRRDGRVAISVTASSRRRRGGVRAAGASAAACGRPERDVRRAGRGRWRCRGTAGRRSCRPSGASSMIADDVARVLRGEHAGERDPVRRRRRSSRTPGSTCCAVPVLPATW